MNTPVSGLHHIALRTPDVDRTVAFYEALGYTRVHGWSLPQIDLRRAVMIQSPDAQLAPEGTAAWTFFGLYDPDHPAASGAAAARSKLNPVE